jgi:23S rRNA (cytosine1962-C5)-methyltransferase
VYDKDLPEFPVSIDIYENKICLSEYRAKHALSPDEYMDWLEGMVTVVSEVTGVPEEDIFTKERRRKSDRFSQYEKTGTEKVFFEVTESGLNFLVNLTDYLDTGLFLDHRVTRQMVRDLSKNKKVLNLFAYTGSFSVYAAEGSAAKVTTVDLSNTYLQWAKNNFAIGRGDYHWKHEPCLYGWKDGAAHYFAEDRTQSTIFQDKKIDVKKRDVQVMYYILFNAC